MGAWPDVRVLIADDNRRVRSALTHLFTATPGFEVTGTEHAADAVARSVAQHRPDVALVDLLTPDLDAGLRLVRLLSREHRVPVLALSAQAGMRSSALSAGATAFLDEGSGPAAVIEAARRTAVTPTLLTDAVRYPESPRWHDDRLWFSDVHAYAVKTVDLAGDVSTVVEVPGRPAGLGFLPDGRLLVASALDRKLWIWDGEELALAADLSAHTSGLLNDMVVDGSGRAFVGDTGFNLMAGESPRPGQVLVYDAGRVGVATADVEFPNGAVLSPDGRRYWVCETSAQRVSTFDVAPDGTLSGKRVLIELPDWPDGLCLDRDGAVWVALLRLGEFWRVLPDGSVATKLSADGRLAVACVLGDHDRRTLFLCSADTTMAELARGHSAGLIHTRPALPGAGWP